MKKRIPAVNNLEPFTLILDRGYRESVFRYNL